MHSSMTRYSPFIEVSIYSHRYRLPAMALGSPGEQSTVAWHGSSQTPPCDLAYIRRREGGGSGERQTSIIIG